jgi:hypothetical protein
MGRGLLMRFAVGALVGVVAAVAVGAVMAGPQIGSTAPPGKPVSLLDENGGEIDFRVVEGLDPQPVAPLPVDASVQLVAFHSGGPSAPPGGGEQQPWWNDTVPRIQPITQFDGGPLQGVNCLMAAAAMLARLGYGIVTTGSQMRALSGDTFFGTTYPQAQDALDRGWGVRFFMGALTPLQLRAVLWAGAGAVIDGEYGEIPVENRVQKNFEGRHAIYVDAFSLTAYRGGPAYYVMDPIGRASRGYRGDWWPADAVERMTAQLAGGRISTMWAFPGGQAPTNRPVLPPEAYPSTGPGATPLPSGEMTDPYPPDDVPEPPAEEDGEDTGADEPTGGVDVTTGEGTVDPGYQECAIVGTKLGCPIGVIGIVDLTDRGPPPTRPPLDFDILYGTMLEPGMYQIIFEPPPDTTRSDLWFWSDASGGKLEAATVEKATLDGREVSVGTIILDPTLDYSFVATAEGDGLRSVSTVGGIEVRE